MKYSRSGLLAVGPQAFFLDWADFAAVPNDVVGDACVVTIRGPLTHHATGEFDSYDGIQARCQSAFDSQQPRVILDIDSPGGDVAGAFDLASWLREQAAARGKTLHAYVRGTAASAAFALACAASKIGISQTGFAGSIGIINAIQDQTAADTMMGLRFTFVMSGARKGDGNPHIATTDAAVSHLQTQVDALADVFFRWVADTRGIGIAKVIGLQATALLAPKAVAAGLVDEICTWDQMLHSPADMAGSLERKDKAMADEEKKEAPKDEPAAEGGEYDMKGLRDHLGKMRSSGSAEQRETADKMLKMLDKHDAPEAASDEEPAKEEPKKEEASQTSAGAQAVDPLTAALARLQALEIKNAKAEEAQARAALLATRPDFSPEVRAMAASLPISALKQICETLPKVETSNPLAKAAGVVGVAGTRDVAPVLSRADEDFIAAHMRGAARGAGVKRTGPEAATLELGHMTPAQAAEFLASKGAK